MNARNNARAAPRSSPRSRQRASGGIYRIQVLLIRGDVLTEQEPAAALDGFISLRRDSRSSRLASTQRYERWHRPPRPTSASRRRLATLLSTLLGVQRRSLLSQGHCRQGSSRHPYSRQRTRSAHAGRTWRRCSHVRASQCLRRQLGFARHSAARLVGGSGGNNGQGSNVATGLAECRSPRACAERGRPVTQSRTVSRSSRRRYGTCGPHSERCLRGAVSLSRGSVEPDRMVGAARHAF